MPARSAPRSVEERPLLRVIGAGGVAVRRDGFRGTARRSRVRARERLGRRVPLAPRELVQPLGERLREPVGERAHHDRAGSRRARPRSGRRAPRPPWIATANAPTWSASPVSAGATKSASERFGRESVVVALLAQHREPRLPPLEHDVVALRGRGPEAVDAARAAAARPAAISSSSSFAARRGRARPRPSRGRRGSPG